MRIGADDLERVKTELFFKKLKIEYHIPTLNFAYQKWRVKFSIGIKIYFSKKFLKKRVGYGDKRNNRIKSDLVKEKS